MSLTISNLVYDILPRLTKAPHGMTIYQAASSVQNLIYKHMIDMESDLIASGELALTINAGDRSAILPSDFVSLAERPHLIYTDESGLPFSNTAYLAGSVQSYNASSGVMVVLVNKLSQAIWQGLLGSWTIAIPTPDWPLQAIAASSTMLPYGTGQVTLTITTGLSLQQGQYVYIFNGTLPPTTGPTSYPHRKHRLEPEYLDEDDFHDDAWWTWYGTVSYAVDSWYWGKKRYKIVGSTLYLHAAEFTQDVVIHGRYNQKPSYPSGPTYVIPWSQWFYEIMREAVVRVIMTGKAMPSADQEVMMFVKSEMDTILWSRQKELPQRRMHRRDWL